MKLIEVLVCWDPAGAVHVVPQGRQRSPLRRSDCASDSDWRSITDQERKLRLMWCFHAMVVRDGVNPETAHQAFLAIDEYREMIAPDIPGAA